VHLLLPNASAAGVKASTPAALITGAAENNFTAALSHFTVMFSP
jgi:hypothetical protein